MTAPLSNQTSSLKRKAPEPVEQKCEKCQKIIKKIVECLECHIPKYCSQTCRVIHGKAYHYARCGIKPGKEESTEEMAPKKQKTAPIKKTFVDDGTTLVFHNGFCYLGYKKATNGTP